MFWIILIAPHPVTGHCLDDFGFIILMYFYQASIFTNAQDLSELCLHHAIEDPAPSAWCSVKDTQVF